MFSSTAKLLKYFANGPVIDVVDLRNEILGLPGKPREQPKHAQE
jgi:hypothetical protein